MTHRRSSLTKSRSTPHVLDRSGTIFKLLPSPVSTNNTLHYHWKLSDNPSAISSMQPGTETPLWIGSQDAIQRRNFLNFDIYVVTESEQVVSTRSKSGNIIPTDFRMANAEDKHVAKEH
jgi:hypothetical protein